MATLKDVIDHVLENCGRAESGEDRTRALRWITDILKVDIPDRAGGMYAEGYASRSVGGSVYVASGEYAWPTLLRSFGGTIQVDDDVIDPQQIYTHPLPWLRAASSDEGAFTYGKARILVYGRKIRCSPIPPSTPTTPVVVNMWGTVYRDVSSYDEDTDLDTEGIAELQPALEAGATVLEAAKRGRADVLQVWSPIWQRRLDGLRSADHSTWRQPIMGRDV